MNDTTDGGSYIEISTLENGTVMIDPNELDRLVTEMEEYCKTGRNKLLCIQLCYGGEYYIPLHSIIDFGLTSPAAREAHWTRMDAIKKQKKALLPDSD